MTDFQRLRRGMVDCQVRVADVTDHRVIEAFLSVPRETFGPADREDVAYLDQRTPLGQPGRFGYDPMTLAKLVQLSAPRGTDSALVVGAGLGYTAAILSELVGRVVALECSPALAAGARSRLADRSNVTVVEGALPAGAPDLAPFDLIFCDGAVSANLDALAGQLAPGGRIVAPYGADRATKATVFRAHGGELAPASSFDAYGPLLPGFEPVEAFAF